MRTHLPSSPSFGKNEKNYFKQDNHVTSEKQEHLVTRIDSNNNDHEKSKAIEGQDSEGHTSKDLEGTGSSNKGDLAGEHQGGHFVSQEERTQGHSPKNERSPKNESSHTTVEWQNELARHILSMYASTTASTNMSHSKAILEFVDGTGDMTADSLSNDLFMDGKSSDDRNSSAKDGRNTGGSSGVRSRGRGKHDTSNDLDESGSHASHKSDVSSVKSIKSDSKALRDERKTKDNITIIRDFSTISPSRSLAGSSNGSQADSKFGSNRKNRSNNRNDSDNNDGNISVVTGALSCSSNKNRTNAPQNERLVNGEAYLRLNGPPRCFPVWFVGKEAVQICTKEAPTFTFERAYL